MVQFQFSFEMENLSRGNLSQALQECKVLHSLYGLCKHVSIFGVDIRGRGDFFNGLEDEESSSFFILI